MALTTCPDCGRQVSTEASTCPGCGRPIAGARPQEATPGTAPPAAPAVTVFPRSRGIYIILGILVGVLGIHNFYAGYYARGAIQLAITVFLGWILVGFVITGIWVLIDLFTVTRDAAGKEMV